MYVCMCVVHADIMLQMGFFQEEIQDSLVTQKYNEVMATYLLLDFRNSEVFVNVHTYLTSAKSVCDFLSAVNPFVLMRV